MGDARFLPGLHQEGVASADHQNEAIGVLGSPLGYEPLELGRLPGVASAGDSQNFAWFGCLDAAQIALIEFLANGMGETVEVFLNPLRLGSVHCLTGDRFKLCPRQ